MRLLKILGVLLALLLVPQVLAATVAISPENPTDVTDLTCRVEGSNNVFNFYWYRDGSYEGVSTSSTSSILSAAETSAGEEWTCIAYRPSTTFIPEQYIGEASVVIEEEPLWAIPYLIPTPEWAVPHLIPACNDGLDNDGDGDVDLADLGCSSSADTDESNRPLPPECSDGFDNDRDGDVDMDDFGCLSPSDDDEEFPQPLSACSDGRDNDGDGFIDRNDPGCSSQADNDEANPTLPSVTFDCSDGIDNDGDGLADWLSDPGCSSPVDTDESNADYPDCLDNVDNDGDGLADFGSDPGCSSPLDGDETDPASPPACSDSADNDGDGMVDLADAGCIDANDTDETDPAYPALPQCSDALDNDGDSLIDAHDPGCASPTDNNEFNLPTVPADTGDDSVADNGRPRIMDVSIIGKDGKLEIHTTVKNVGRGRIDSGIVTVFVDQLNEMSVSSFVHLPTNRQLTLVNVLELPENLEQNNYLVSIRVHANGKEDVVYRVVELGEEVAEQNGYNVLVIFGNNTVQEEKLGFFARILNWFISLFKSLFY